MTLRIDVRCVVWCGAVRSERVVSLATELSMMSSVAWVGVVVGLVPVGGEGFACECECEVFEVGWGYGGCEELELDGCLDPQGYCGADAGDDVAYRCAVCGVVWSCSE